MSGAPDPTALDPAALAVAVAAAHRRLGEPVRRTPVLPSPWLSACTGIEVRCKLENLQATGSFKVRGALHALLQLDPAARRAGVVAASSGNHGLGIAAAAARLGIPALVCVPESTPAARRAAITAHGAALQVIGSDCVHTERHARALALADGRHYVSPYNDLDVVAGQGTIAVELLAQWPAVDTLYVALGGGGLLAGMAAYAKSLRPDLEVVGCSPQQSGAMAECVRRGRIVEVPCGPTWSDSTAGGVEPGAITFAWCQRLVDRFVDVDEAAIAAAMRECLQRDHLLVEGAAGVAVAGCLADAERSGRCAAVLLCGGNLALDRLRVLLAE